MKSSKVKIFEYKYFHLPAVGSDHNHYPFIKNFRGNGLSIYLYIKIVKSI
jgi:hypothetical protein